MLVVEYTRLLVRTGWARWEGFWFTPRATGLLGVLRILTGCMLVYTHLVWGLALSDFFGENSWISRELALTLHDHGTNDVAPSFWWYVSGPSTWFAHAAAMLVLTAFTLGVATRFTAPLAFAVVVSYVNRVPTALFGLDQINSMLTLYLAIGYAGVPAVDRRLSCDRWWALRGNAPDDGTRAFASANLGLRLVQVHMCVIYFFAGISKLQGMAWWDGTAMWLAFANLEYQTLDMTWLAHHPWVVDVMTHVTIVWEISFCVLVWRPLLRPLVLLGAVALHAGIGVCLGMWTFALIMLVGCASFLPEAFFTPPISDESDTVVRARSRNRSDTARQRVRV